MVFNPDSQASRGGEGAQHCSQARLGSRSLLGEGATQSPVLAWWAAGTGSSPALCNPVQGLSNRAGFERAARRVPPLKRPQPETPPVTIVPGNRFRQRSQTDSFSPTKPEWGLSAPARRGERQGPDGSGAERGRAEQGSWGRSQPGRGRHGSAPGEETCTDSSPDPFLPNTWQPARDDLPVSPPQLTTSSARWWGGERWGHWGGTRASPQGRRTLERHFSWRRVLASSWPWTAQGRSTLRILSSACQARLPHSCSCLSRLHPGSQPVLCHAATSQ